MAWFCSLRPLIGSPVLARCQGVHVQGGGVEQKPWQRHGHPHGCRHPHELWCARCRSSPRIRTTTAGLGPGTKAVRFVWDIAVEK